MSNPLVPVTIQAVAPVPIHQGDLSVKFTFTVQQNSATLSVAGATPITFYLWNASLPTSQPISVTGSLATDGADGKITCTTSATTSPFTTDGTWLVKAWVGGSGLGFYTGDVAFTVLPTFNGT